MNPEIKLKRLCQKGNTAKLILQLIADRGQRVSVFDHEGNCLIGDGNATATRHPIAVEADDTIGWVCCDEDSSAILLAALIGYMAQKELEGKLLAQETLSKYKELTLLYELGEKIAACLDIEELARLALDEARRLLPSGKDIQLAILLSEQDTGQLSVCAAHGDMYQVGAKAPALDGISLQVLATGNAEIVNDVRKDPRYQGCAGGLPDIQSMLCVPLRTRDKTFGLLSVVSRMAVNFSAGESKVLNLLASQVAVAVGRVHLIHERVAQERLQESLKLSHSIQMSMLSTVFPRFSQGGPVDLFAFMEPAREVSGDFYDFFHLDDKTLLIVIGDVSDKGVPAALFMVMVKTLIRAMAKHYVHPEQVLAAVNPELCRDNDTAMFVTLFIATLDLGTGVLTYSFGGHNQPLYLSRYGIVSMLQGDSGTALGIMDGVSYTAQTMQLHVGDSLLLYTDGISEAMDIANEAYGEQRMCQLMTGLPGHNAEELVATMIASVNTFTQGAEQSDDITLLALQWRQGQDGS
ncbi:MAG: SpoIIE family protein phosphatase [Methylovulum sp.]|nr:SpoIIE family protein phosphatase [Methylovulum sp.]